MEHQEEKDGVFEGTCPYEKTWWIQRTLFSWVVPLVKYAHKNGKLTTDHFGELSADQDIFIQTEKFRKVWDRKRAGNVTKNTLTWTIVSCYKWNFLYLMLGNLVSSTLNIT